MYLIQESHSTAESSELWTREWGGQTFYTHGSPNSKGVAIFFNKQGSIKVRQVQDGEGRFIGMDLIHEDQVLTVALIYTPTQDKSREQMAFLEGVKVWLSQLEAIWS